MIRIILVAVIIFSLSQNVHANYNVNEKLQKCMDVIDGSGN